MGSPAVVSVDRGSGRPLLAVSNLSVRFGGITALDGVSFDVPAQAIVGLIGPNGAGKTTVFNCLSRLYEVDEGTIHFDGHALLELPPHRIASLGIGRTFQNLALFKTLSVLENVMLGGHTGSRHGFLHDALGLRSVRRREEELRTEAQRLLALVDLERHAERPVSDLPFAIQKRVELARALMTAPRLLLLDEPAGGLNPTEVQELLSLVQQIRETRPLTILLVEHHMELVMALSDRVVVLNFGQKIAEGPPERVQQDPEVLRAYLGDTA